MHPSGFGQSDCERSVEDVAGGGRIDSVCFESGDRDLGRTIEVIAALVAKLQKNRLAALFQQSPGKLGRVVQRYASCRAIQQETSLRFVGRQDIDLRKHFAPKRLRGSWVKDGLDAKSPGHCQHCSNRLNRSFQLEQHTLRSLEYRRECLRIIAREGMICTGRDNDRVLALVIHANEGNSGGLRFCGVNETDVDSCSGEAGLQMIGEDVIADSADHLRVYPSLPQSAHGTGLICAFSSRNHLKFRTEGGLTRRRQAAYSHDEVHIETTDDGDMRKHARPV